jgi:hypothetical protein
MSSHDVLSAGFEVTLYFPWYQKHGALSHNSFSHCVLLFVPLYSTALQYNSGIYQAVATAEYAAGAHRRRTAERAAASTAARNTKGTAAARTSAQTRGNHRRAHRTAQPRGNRHRARRNAQHRGQHRRAHRSAKHPQAAQPTSARNSCPSEDTLTWDWTWPGFFNAGSNKSQHGFSGRWELNKHV